MVDISPAVFPAEQGTILIIEVSSGSKKPNFPVGYNEWRKAVGCAVQAPAREGKANREVITLISMTLGVPKNRVRILSGETSTMKKILIENCDQESIMRILTDAIRRS
jgi:uncharacterized protein (TIGR00251 family)